MSTSFRDTERRGRGVSDGLAWFVGGAQGAGVLSEVAQKHE